MIPTREAWLTKLTDLLRPDFSAHAAPLPAKLRIACGWPSSGAFRSTRRVIGECWPCTASADGSIEIFVSPALSDPLAVGATLVHELVHAAVGTACGHRGGFKRLARALGLDGPMRSTHAGDVLKDRLNALAGCLGPYPHATLDAPARPGKTQSTRLLKVGCPDCGCLARMSFHWISQGLPTCRCGTQWVEEFVL